MIQGTFKTAEDVMVSGTAFGRFFRAITRPANALLLVFWIAYFAIWSQGWTDSKIFDPLWWFDAAGHATFGFAGALTFLYWYRRYAAEGVFRIAGRLFLIKGIIADIIIFGAFWELVELLWDLVLQPDFFYWIAKAQKDSVDTTIDMLVNAAFAALAMFAWLAWLRIYAWRYPDESERAEIAELKERIEYVSNEVAVRRVQNIRNFNQELLPSLRKLIERLRRVGGNRNSRP